MEKGKLGIKICFYAVLSFILAALGYSTALFMVAGVVLLVEKNEWATRQVLQAIALCFIESVVGTALSFLSFLYSVPVIGSMWGKVYSGVDTVMAVLVFALCIVGVLKTMKGEDAAIPVASKFADWAYGVTAAKTEE